MDTDVLALYINSHNLYPALMHFQLFIMLSTCLNEEQKSILYFIVKWAIPGAIKASLLLDPHETAAQ